MGMTHRDVTGGKWEGGSCLGTHVRIKDFKIKKIKNLIGLHRTIFLNECIFHLLDFFLRDGGCMGIFLFSFPFFLVFYF